MSENIFRNPSNVYPPSGKYTHGVQVPPGARIHASRVAAVQTMQLSVRGDKLLACV